MDHERQFRNKATLGGGSWMVDATDCRRDLCTSMDCLSCSGACSTELVTYTLGSGSQLAGSANRLVLVPCRFQSRFVCSRVPASLAHIMGQTVAQTYGHFVAHARTSAVHCTSVSDVQLQARARGTRYRKCAQHVVQADSACSFLRRRACKSAHIHSF